MVSSQIGNHQAALINALCRTSTLRPSDFFPIFEQEQTEGANGRDIQATHWPLFPPEDFNPHSEVAVVIRWSFYHGLHGMHGFQNAPNRFGNRFHNLFT